MQCVTRARTAIVRTPLSDGPIATGRGMPKAPNLTKLHVHPCHYGSVVHPAERGGSRVLAGPGGASE